MLARIFSKTSPLNYLIVGVLSFLFFLFYFFSIRTPLTIILFLKEFGSYLVLLGSLFLVNFILLKNNLTKNNTYTLMFFLIFILFFPNIFSNKTILISCFFIMLSLRRILSLKININVREKIFDASFWIFIASLFYFWSILFIILVFASIILHASNNYKNWLVPFIAFASIFIILLMISFVTSENIYSYINTYSTTSFNFSYFSNVYEQISLAMFTSISILIVANQIIDLRNKPLNMQSLYKLVFLSLIIGIVIYVISNNKTNALLFYCLPPLAIISANFLERVKEYWFKEVIITGLFVLGIIFFIVQL